MYKVSRHLFWKTKCQPDKRVLDYLYFVDDGFRTVMVETISYSNIGPTQCLQGL